MRRRWHRHYWVPFGVIACAALLGGSWYGVHLLDPGPQARAATLPTAIRYRTTPGHTVTRLKRVRVRHVVYRHGKRLVTFQTVTRPVSVFVPPTTVAVTGPVQTTVRTVDGTIFRTFTLPGQTVTQTLPGRTDTTTVVVTQPGTTVTDTLPVTQTETDTVTETGTTVTVTVTDGGGGST